MSRDPTRHARGSEWRRWDLHVHTPHSSLNHGFSANFDDYARTLLTKAVGASIAAIGVTDYFTIEGYKELRARVDNDQRLVALVGEEVAEKAREILLIPNIELRLRDVVVTDGKESRVNFHVLFSDALTPVDIEEQFLHRLRFIYEGKPGGPDQEKALTVNNLTELGARLREQHAPFRDRSDLVIGMTNAVVSHEKVTELLTSQQALFKDRYLTIVPADEDLADINWNGQGHLVRKMLLQKAEMVFSASASTRAFCLGEKHETIEDFVREFKTRKACVHGSDAHRDDELFESTGRRYLWIKADPTFNGLRQLLHEPEARVFIGERPSSLTLVEENATKYLDQVSFARDGTAQPAEKWFTGSVPLNPGLVAVIGKKGSGKSALADILGVVGNSRTRADFSFLIPQRFLSPKNGLGHLFRAEITWRSGKSFGRLLSDASDTSLPESVEYIPQNHLERICSEIGDSSSTTGFDRELETVIFSHVDPAERLGKETLRELLDYRTEEKGAALKQQLQKLSDVNRAIVSLQDRLTTEHRARLEGQRAQRQSELDAHDATKPELEVEPSQDPDKLATSNIVRDDLALVVEKIEGLDKQIASNLARREQAAREIAAADRLLDRVANLESTVESFYDDSADDVGLIGVNIKSVVKLTSDTTALRQLRGEAADRSDELVAAVDSHDEGSLVSQRGAASLRAEELREKLDEPTRRYEEYLRRLAGWNQRGAEILGTPTDPQSLKGVAALLQAIGDVPELLEKQRALRADLVRKIFAVKVNLLADYEALYSPVQEFIDGHEVSQEMNALSFSATIAVEGMVDGLLGMIHHGRRGGFQGEAEGRERLETIVAGHGVSTAAEVEAFTTEVLEILLGSDPDGKVPDLTALRGQLVQTATPEQVYNFLFGLSYLQPRFGLLWRGKPLDQLSPGERGTLLLVFYLLIDRRDLPLIIDQPEENLDNETIFELLVPAIMHAKARRQVIIVTHNPNLAVVCDADQVIHSSIDKAHGNAITYTAGSIEHPEITRMIVDVLEGTKPAFDLRDAKYDVLERSS